MMVESHDLTTVDSRNTNGQSSDNNNERSGGVNIPGVVLRITKDADKEDGQEVFVPFAIPPDVTHLKVYTNHNLPRDFLAGFTGLKTIDLSALSHLTELPDGFLSDCSGLETLDLGPFSRVTDIWDSAAWDEDGDHRCTFLARCTSLKTLDLSPLSNIQSITAGFLRGCSGLNGTIDLRPLSNLQHIDGLLEGCTGLTSLDLSPLTQLSTWGVVGVLEGCPNLKTLTLSKTYHVPLINLAEDFGDVEIVYVE